MRPVLVAVLVVVACASPQRPPPPPATDEGIAMRLVGWDLMRRRAEANLLTIPLPRIAVREPVGIDPTLQVAVVAVPRVSPHFPTVAMAWPTICERRGALPDDVFAYAMTWCAYARDGHGDLESALVRFTSSTVPGLRAAAIDDLVNVVAEAHDAATAMRVLAKVAAPAGTLEKLAAVYDVLGRSDDEALVRTKLPRPPKPPTDCADLEEALDPFEPRSLEMLRGVARGSTACASAARAIVCRIAAVSPAAPRDASCASTAAPLDERERREAHYLAAYAQWGADWFAVVDHATNAMPEPGAEQVAIAALTASLRSGCTETRLSETRKRAEDLLRVPAHDPRWTPSLASLAAITPKQCEALPRAARTWP